MTRPIILALPKGRILEEAAAVFARAGYDLSPVFGDSRRLVHECGPLRVLVLRNSDIATYVAHGAADVGVAGSDVLDEDGRDLLEPLDLAIGRCRMIVAERAEPAPPPPGATHSAWDEASDRAQAHLRVATKYPRTTRAYLQRKGITAEVIKLSGAIELGPLTGLCDRIVDITQTGETLRQNGLVEVETLLESQAVLIARRDLSPEQRALTAELRLLIDSVLAARPKRYVMLNARDDRLEEVLALLPGLEAPTVLPLARGDMHAVHAVVDQGDVVRLLGPLKARGASGILVLPIEHLIP
jgi:ATP phosphoribosyltransferase